VRTPSSPSPPRTQKGALQPGRAGPHQPRRDSTSAGTPDHPPPRSRSHQSMVMVATPTPIPRQNQPLPAKTPPQPSAAGVLSSGITPTVTASSNSGRSMKLFPRSCGLRVADQLIDGTCRSTQEVPHLTRMCAADTHSRTADLGAGSRTATDVEHWKALRREQQDTEFASIDRYRCCERGYSSHGPRHGFPCKPD